MGLVQIIKSALKQIVHFYNYSEMDNYSGLNSESKNSKNKYSYNQFNLSKLEWLVRLPLLIFLLVFFIEAQAVSLEMDGSLAVISGVDCGLATYRLGTKNSYKGKALDMLLEVTEEDNDRANSCVNLTSNQISFWLKDFDNGDNVAYMDLKFTIVQKGTTIPVEVDRILVTNFDLDRSNNLNQSATDDVYYKNADGVYTSSNSLVEYSEGSFYGKYNAKMRGINTGNCNDNTTTTDVTCRAGAIWINGPNGKNKVSSIYARVQNDNAYGTDPSPNALRLLQFSFDVRHFQNLVTEGTDYGDAPNSYGSTGHKTDVNIGLGFGEVADSEAGHQASALANSDDIGNTGFDDENAVSLSGQPLDGSILEAETTYNLSVTTYGAGYLSGWIDWNRDGDFNDTDENFLTDHMITSNSVEENNVALTIPSSISSGNSYLRFRYSMASGVAASGFSNSRGEVEDYLINLRAISVSGRVYNDTNVDGHNDPAEKGVSGLSVVLVNVTNNTCVSTKTDAVGHYEFFPVTPGNYRLYEASRETIPVPQNCDITLAKDPVGYRSTTVNVLPEFSVVEADIEGKDFGNVKSPVFLPDHSNTVLPGNVVFYSHKFTPKSDGIVDFTHSDTAGLVTGWISVIYQDNNCNGELDGVDANAPVASDLAVTAGQAICLINKVSAPASINGGDVFTNLIHADFNFNNVFAGTKSLKVTDISKAAVNDPVIGSAKLELRKTVENLTQLTPETETQNQAKPGDILKYRIYYSNTGTGLISDLKINDVVPEFTVFNNLDDCSLSLPSSLTGCTSTRVGKAIEWTFDPGNKLEGGSKGLVSYSVIVD